MKHEDDPKECGLLVLKLLLEGFLSELHSSTSKRPRLLPQHQGDRFVHPTNSRDALIQILFVQRVTSAPLCLVQDRQDQSIQK